MQLSAWGKLWPQSIGAGSLKKYLLAPDRVRYPPPHDRGPVSAPSGRVKSEVPGAAFDANLRASSRQRRKPLRPPLACVAADLSLADREARHVELLDGYAALASRFEVCSPMITRVRPDRLVALYLYINDVTDPWLVLRKIANRGRMQSPPDMPYHQVLGMPVLSIGAVDREIGADGGKRRSFELDAVIRLGAADLADDNDELHNAPQAPEGHKRGASS